MAVGVPIEVLPRALLEGSRNAGKGGSRRPKGKGIDRGKCMLGTKIISQRRGSALLPMLKDGFWIGLFGLISYVFLFNLSVVRGSSMAPGITDGDRILIETWSHQLEDLDRGDVVVLSSPVEPGVDYIKRVIGLPGDEILIAEGNVWVNGEQLDEDYAVPQDAGLFQWTRVLDGHLYVMGDNRPHSSDSREFGQVAEELLQGRVRLRVWPLGSVGLLD